MGTIYATFCDFKDVRALVHANRGIEPDVKLGLHI